MLLQCNVMCNHFTQDNMKRRKNNAKQCEMKQNEAKQCNSPPPKRKICGLDPSLQKNMSINTSSLLTIRKINVLAYKSMAFKYPMSFIHISYFGNDDLMYLNSGFSHCLQQF